MKVLNIRSNLIIVVLLLTAYAAEAQTTATDNSKTKKVNEMKTYVIERDLPGAGKLTAVELKAVSQTSCGVLKEMGPKIEWLHSYVTGNKIYCIYRAQSEELIREHGKKGGFPVTAISEISSTISPATAEQ